MSNVRQIQNATLVFCVFQIGCLLVGGISYGLFAYRIRHFDYGQLRIDEEKILRTIGESTRRFLVDEMTNQNAKVEIRQPETDMESSDGCVWQTLKRSGARIDGIDYGVGDYIKSGTNLYEIFVLDLDRQRVYGVAANGDKLILCLTGTQTKRPYSGDENRTDTTAGFRRRPGPGESPPEKPL